MQYNHAVRCDNLFAVGDSARHRRSLRWSNNISKGKQANTLPLYRFSGVPLTPFLFRLEFRVCYKSFLQHMQMKRRPYNSRNAPVESRSTAAAVAVKTIICDVVDYCCRDIWIVTRIQNYAAPRYKWHVRLCGAQSPHEFPLRWFTRKPDRHPIFGVCVFAHLHRIIFILRIFRSLSFGRRRAGVHHLSRSEIMQICQTRAWMLSMGFTLAYGAMFSKVWRVHRFTTKQKQDPKVC